MSVETIPFIRGLERMARAAGRRVADGDEPEMEELMVLRATVEEAVQTAVDAWRAMDPPRSWSEIGAAMGVTRQAAQQRYGKGKAA